MCLYLEDQGVTDETKKATKIKIALGDEGIRRILASGLSEADQADPKKIWSLIETEVDATTKINFRVHRLEFSSYTQKPDESLSQYLSRLREKATKCEFEPAELNERLIEMVILSTPYEDFRKELLTKPKGHEISIVLERGREYEAIAASTASLKTLSGNTATNMDAIRRQNNSQKQQQNPQNPCKNCGLSHPPRSCPAYNDRCSACKSIGHWKRMCRKTNGGKNIQGNNNRQNQQDTYRQPHKHTNVQRQHEVNVEEDPSADSTLMYMPSFSMITIANLGVATNREAFTKLIAKHINPPVYGPIDLKVDTGSGGNTLPLRTYKQMFGETPTSQILTPEPAVKLTSYSGDNIPCLGSLTLSIRKPSNPTFTHEKFYVVDVSGPAILGLPSCRKLGVVEINVNEINETAEPTSQTGPIRSIEQLKMLFPAQFDQIGNFKEPATLHLKNDAIPFCDPPRKVSIHLSPRIKAELDKMEKDGIIRRVTEHTDWCSSLVYVTKPDGSLRVCLDPKRLNQNLRRCPHKIPTLEEINPIFSKAEVFSKLDAKAGYWSIPLHEESQLLTTFRTPFGRYCWKRLPFGLNVSQDIFQARMDCLLEDLPGVVGIADDVVICGQNQAEHDRNLIAFMKRATQHGLSLNSKKCSISKPEINFFGTRYTNKGTTPDLSKINDLHNMPSPSSKEELQKFLGLMTYLSPYIPHYSAQSQRIRDLTKEDVPFQWEEDHEMVYQHLKKQISPDSTLSYYNPSQTVTLEVDASQKGLGAALIQNDKVIAFASKTLTPTQANYSNIEREALGLVHGVQRFHTYLYGREFEAVTDHKPLVNIWEKPLTSAPPRLQRLFLKLQGYDMTLKYKEGKSLILSDTLSRLPNPQNDREIPLDARVDGMDIGNTDDLSIDLLNFGPQILNEIREGSDKDPVLRTLKHTIIEGWPKDIKSCHTDIRPFFSYRECLAVEDGIIFKGRQVIIPKEVRSRILKQLHQSHQGINKTQALARECVFWPNISRDIQDTVRACGSCQKYQPQQSQGEPINHDIPPMPWFKIGSDLFQVNQKVYLVVVDYFTKFPIVTELNNLSSASVTNHLKSLCSVFGCPKILVSDNGPQYTGTAMRDFTQSWGIEHITSSPHYPQSNGLAERTVGTCKGIIKKCLETGEDINRAMLHLRATPIDNKTPSPAELIFGRRIATDLPSRYDPNPEHIATRNHLQGRGAPTQKEHRYTELQPEQPVRIFDKASHTWTPGNIVNKTTEPQSYIVETQNGAHLRRNRNHLRPVPLNPSPCDPKTPTKGTASAPKPWRPTNPEQIGHSPPHDNPNNEPEHQPPVEAKNQSPPPIKSPGNSKTTSSGRTVKSPHRLIAEI